MRQLRLFIALLLISSVVHAQTRQLTGSVTDSKSSGGLPAVTIKVKGKNVQTLSSPEGVFSLTVPTGSLLLEISTVGYTSKTISVGATSNNVVIALDATTGQLGEVVVTALGIQRKAKSLTYSTEEVKGAALTAVPETNIMNSLQGKVSGLNVYRGSGGAGSSVNVVIRGIKSFGNNQPLYVIDGVPFQNNSPTQPAGIFNGAALPDAGDNISQINTDDIEGVTILKGAGATALYGSQGQNGVVLITTKKGRAGAIALEYSETIMLIKQLTRQNCNILTGKPQLVQIIAGPLQKEPIMIQQVNFLELVTPGRIVHL